MTYFDKIVNFIAKTCQVSDLLEKEENDDFVFFKVRGLSSYNNLMQSEYHHAVQKLEKAVNQTNKNANGGKRFGF